jgi:hypothetical protein
MLFLLVMEALSAKFRRVDSWSLFQPLGSRPIPHRVSLYADDMMLFVAPRQQDLNLVRSILLAFEGVSGLGCNMAKCQMAPLCCPEE